MHNPKVISFFAGGKIAMLSFLLLTVSTLSAADIYLTGGDTGGQNSFENGTHFDGNSPSPVSRSLSNGIASATFSLPIFVRRSETSVAPMSCASARGSRLLDAERARST